VPHKIVIGVDRETQLKLIINDYDNFKDQTIEWKCFDAKQKECDLFEPSKTHVQTMRLFSTGENTVQGSVKVNGVEKKVTSTVVAESDIYCSVHFENYPDKPLIAGNKFMVYFWIFKKSRSRTQFSLFYSLTPPFLTSYPTVTQNGRL
jgi:hypothetical protein